MTTAPDTLRKFSERHRVKIKNTGAELVAPGRFGEIANDYGDGFLRLRLLAVPRNSAAHDKALRSRGRKAAAAGMVLKVRSGAESISLFRPEDEAHARLAITLVLPKRKRTRILTPEQKAVLVERLARARTAKSGMVGNAT